AAPIDPLRVRMTREQLGGRPERGDAAVADEERGVVENRVGVVDRDDRCVVDQRGGHARYSHVDVGPSQDGGAAAAEAFLRGSVRGMVRAGSQGARSKGAL